MFVVSIPLVESFDSSITLKGYLAVPDDDSKDNRIPNTKTKRIQLVIFVHGSGSSRDSSRNQYLANELNKNGIGTFLFDLLTNEEEESDKKVENILQSQIPALTLNKFNIALLADRLIKATEYILQIPQLQEEKKELDIGYFGASTGVAAALYACGKICQANPTTNIKTIVSRGGRPDLFSFLISNQNVYTIENLNNIRNCPLLFIIGQKDKLVLDWTKNFIKNYKLVDNSKLEIVKNATHSFEELGTLEKVGDIAVRWFIQHL